MKRWISIQLGSREHYAVPRALTHTSKLERFYVDAWIPPERRALARKFGTRALAERFHEDLAHARITSFTGRRFAFEFQAMLRAESPWEKIYSRNLWFQEVVSRTLESDIRRGRIAKETNTVFAYSYAAASIFHVARREGFKTVLGQIDPGPYELEYVREHSMPYRALALDAGIPPTGYWDDWRNECHTADTIIVNSDWSKQCLVRVGVEEDKIAVIPLAYAAPERLPRLHCVKPYYYSKARPLSVLFLGQIILRKGVGQIFDAIKLLKDEPVEFTFSGPVGVNVPPDISSRSNVRFTGPVPRSTALDLYKQADVFLLPTLSDGFAITQLEAFAHGLPCIVSKNCGSVVQDGLNGVLLDSVSSEHIAAALKKCLDDAEFLPTLRTACTIEPRFSLEALAANLDLL